MRAGVVASQRPKGERTGDDLTQTTLAAFGRPWYARDSDFRSGAPQYNDAWKRTNVALSSGQPVLTLSNPTGTSPSGAEIVSRQTFGYGTYLVQATGNFESLPPGVVFGAFTFDWTATGQASGYNEIDLVEVSQWNKGLPVTAKVTWYTDAGDPVVLGEVAWPAGKTQISVRLDYAAQYLRVRIYAGDESTTAILDKTTRGALIPPHRKEAMHLNLWNGQWGGTPTDPQAVPATTVTVTNFTFDPNFTPPAAPTPSTSVSFRSAASAQLSTAGTGGVSVTKPAGVTEGDLLLMFVAVDASTVDVDSPSGLTFLDFNTDSPLRVYAWWKIATASEPASYAWTSSAATKMAAAVVAYSGIDGSAPISAFDYRPEAGSSVTAHTTPPISVPADSFIVGAGFDLGSLSSWTSDAGTDVQRVEVKNTTTPGLSLAVFDGAGAVVESTQQRTFTASTASSRASAWLIALKGG